MSALESIHNNTELVWDRRVATELIIRQSCGCLLAKAQAVPSANSLTSDLEIIHLIQHQTTEMLVKYMETFNRFGLMTSQLLAALDLSDTAKILKQRLPQLGIAHPLAGLYLPGEDDL
jgi:hypothetical protein